MMTPSRWIQQLVFASVVHDATVSAWYVPVCVVRHGFILLFRSASFSWYLIISVFTLNEEWRTQHTHCEVECHLPCERHFYCLVTVSWKPVWAEQRSSPRVIGEARVIYTNDEVTDFRDSCFSVCSLVMLSILLQQSLRLLIDIF